MEVVVNAAEKTVNTDGNVVERLMNNNNCNVPPFTSSDIPPFTNGGGYEHMFADKRLFIQCIINAISDSETDYMLTHLLLISRSILNGSNEILLIQKLVELKLELIKK